MYGLFLCMLRFNFFAMFSGVAFFNSISLTLYNFLTGIPPLAYAMDRDLARSILTGNPMLYVQTRRGLSFTYNTAIGWFFLAFLHVSSSLLFFSFFSLVVRLLFSLVLEMNRFSYSFSPIYVSIIEFCIQGDYDRRMCILCV